MRIAVLVDGLDPARMAGAETSALLQAEELVRRGHDVHIITAGPFDDLTAFTTVGGVTGERLHAAVRRLPDYATATRRVVVGEAHEAVRRFRPDIVHTHVIHNYFSMSVLDGLRSTGAVIVAGVHDHSSLCRGALRCKGNSLAGASDTTLRLPSVARCWVCQRGTLDPRKRSPILQSLASASAVTFTSHALRRFYEVNGFDGRSEVIYSGVPMAWTERADSALTAADAMCPLVVCGGRPKAAKGFELVIDAMAELQRRGVDAQLVVYGATGEGAGSLAEHAVATGVDDCVRFEGWMSPVELRSLLHTATVGVVPSVGADALPRAVLDYLSVGLPTVCSTIGGMPEIVVDGQNGFLFDPFAPGALADRLVELLGDDELCRRVGEAGRATVRAQLTVEAAVDRRLALYDDLLAGARQA